MSHVLSWLCLLGMLQFTVSIDESDCPFLCACVLDSVNGGVNITCDEPSFLPGSFPSNSRHIQFRNAIFNAIPAVNGFSDLKQLSTIAFINSTITTIRACSFAQLRHVDSITFKMCNIQTIQGNSFSNLVNVTSINLLDSIIGQILSYAFHNIKHMKILLMQGSVIQVIHPLAFQDFSHVNSIEIRESIIKRFLVNGFSKFDDVRKLVIGEKTKIMELQCEVFETVLDAGGSLDIQNTHFTCDCKLAWMWSKLDSFQMFFPDSSNQCIDTSDMLSSIDINQLCPDERSRKKGCPPLLPSTPHICSQGFDEIDEPISKVAYPTLYPSTPSGFEHQRLNMGLMVLLLMLTLTYMYC